MTVTITSVFDLPVDLQGVLEPIPQPNTTEKVASFMAKGLELLGYINSLSLKTQHQIIPITKCVNLDNNYFEMFYERYEKKYLHFCEVILDLSRNRVAYGIQAFKKKMESEVAIHSAVALGGKIAGAYEMCSLIAMRALKIGLHPMIISIGRDVKPLDSEPMHEVVVVSDKEIDEESLNILRKRIGDNFYCFVKQLNLSIVIDPILEHSVPSNDLQLDISYKKLLGAMQATKIYKVMAVNTPYDHLQSLVDQLIEEIDSIGINSMLLFQPYSRIVRNKWSELVIEQMALIFDNSHIIWAADSGVYNLVCCVDKDIARTVTDKLAKIPVIFTAVEEGEFLNISICCFELKQWRMLYQALEDYLTELF